MTSRMWIFQIPGERVCCADCMQPLFMREDEDAVHCAHLPGCAYETQTDLGIPLDPRWIQERL